MDFFELDDIKDAAEKFAKSINPAENYRKAFSKEWENPKKAYSYYKEIYHHPPASMQGKVGRSGKMSVRLVYGALATMGMARCSIMVEKWGSVRDFATQLSYYPNYALRTTGEAFLHYLNGYGKHAQNALWAARNNLPFMGEPLTHFVSALDRSAEIFARPPGSRSAGKPRKEHKPNKVHSGAAGQPAQRRPRTAPTVHKQEVHHHHHVVVQNIGEYVAGGKVDIKDSVIQRSQLGNLNAEDEVIVGRTEGEIKLSDKEKVLEEYRLLLETVWEDGIVTEDEFEFLQRIRKHEDITMSEHLKVEKAVKQKVEKTGGGPGNPCPDCGNVLQYVGEYDNWYCWTCKDYKY